VKIAVIGGSGILGSRLVTRLADSGHSVTVVQRGISDYHVNVHQEMGDIRYPGSWCDYVSSASIVFHLASVTNSGQKMGKGLKSELWQINVEGFKNVLNACESSRVRKIVLASSVSVYSDHFKSAIEDTPLGGKTLYARSKIAMERIFKEQCEAMDIKWTIIRLAPIVAPGGAGNINKLAQAIFQNRLPAIPYLDSRTSMISVNTAAEGMMRCGFDSRADNQVFNLAEDDEVSVPQLLEWITDGRHELMPRKLPSIIWYPIKLADQSFSIFGLWRLLGRESPISRLSVARTVSNEKIKNTLDWEIPHRLKQAISDLVAVEKELMNKEIPPA